jgi:hypothetical protein
MAATATGGAVCFPRRVAELLRTALDLRDRHDAGEISRHGLALARGHLASQLSDLILPPKLNAALAGLGSVAGFGVAEACVRAQAQAKWRLEAGETK